MSIKVDTVYVLNKYENIITIFDKLDKDTLIDPEIEETQNSEAKLTFRVKANSKKWKDSYNPENFYLVDGKMFSANFDDSIEEVKETTGEDIITVIAYERQKLLERKFVRAWNSTTGFETIDTFMVVIVSGGNLELYNDGHLVNPKYPKGSSGYVLEGLLYGTGWTVGTCDIYEYDNGELVTDESGKPKYQKFDLETDMENIYDNIKNVQELWGGILIFDSVNKIVHHRDETTYLPYSGYEVKYKKNLVTSNYIGNNKIITKLCPLGEGSLNIKSVNPIKDENGNYVYETVIDEDGNEKQEKVGSVWLTNFSFTDSIYESIENNANIYEAEQLKKWGERKLKELCKPRKELTATTALLNKSKTLEKTGFHFETVNLNDIVDIIDYEMIENKTEQLRVINYRHKVWSNENAELTLSDITLETTDIFKKSTKATNAINNGTLNTSQIIDNYKKGQSLREVLQQVDTILTETRSELTKTDTEIRASVSQITNNVNSLTNDLISQNQKLAELLIAVDNISLKVSDIEELTKTVSGKGKAIMDKAVEGDLISLSIHGYKDFNTKTLNFETRAKTIDGVENICYTNSNYYKSSEDRKQIISDDILVDPGDMLFLKIFGDSENYRFNDVIFKGTNYNNVDFEVSYNKYNFGNEIQNKSELTIKIPEFVNKIIVIFQRTNMETEISVESIPSIKPQIEKLTLLSTLEIPKENGNIYNYSCSSSSPHKVESNISELSYKQDINEKMVNYRITKEATSRFSLATFSSSASKINIDSLPNKYVSTESLGAFRTELNIFIGDSDNSILIQLYNSSIDTDVDITILNTLHIYKEIYSTPSNEFVEFNTNKYFFQLSDVLRELTIEVGTNNQEDVYLVTDDSKFLVTDNDEYLILDTEKETYYDEFTIIDNKATLIRRIGVTDDGKLYLLTNPIYTDYGEVSIPLVNNINILQISDDFIPTVICKYAVQNRYTNLYATKAELKTQIDMTDERIILVANKSVYKDDLISTFNSQITIAPEIITIEGNKIKIKSSYFELTEDGKIIAIAGTIGKWTLTEDGVLYGNSSNVPSTNLALNNVTYQQGAISHSGTGNTYPSDKVSSDTRIRTANLIKLDASKSYKMTFNTNYNVVIQAYDSNQLSINNSQTNLWYTDEFSFTGLSYIAIAIRHSDNQTTITPNEINNVKISLLEVNPNKIIYQCGLDTRDNDFMLYAGCDVTDGKTHSLSESNAYITKSGKMYAKWFEVNGENGHMYINYNNGNPAMIFSKDSLTRYLPNTNRWASEGIGYLNKNPYSYVLWLYDTLCYSIDDGIHDKSLVRFYRIGNNFEDAYTIYWTDIRVFGNRLNGLNNSIYVQGYEVATNASDERLKENIEDSSENALKIIDAIKIRQFDWRKDKGLRDGGKHINCGFIAQEVQKIDDTLVNYNEENDTYQMNVLNITALNTKAIQELNQKIKKRDEILLKLAKKLDMEDEIAELLKNI